LENPKALNAPTPTQSTPIKMWIKNEPYTFAILFSNDLSLGEHVRIQINNNSKQAWAKITT
jgi:hypothetical protein